MEVLDVSEGVVGVLSGVGLGLSKLLVGGCRVLSAVAKLVDARLGEIASLDLLLEQDVELTVCVAQPARGQLAGIKC